MPLQLHNLFQPGMVLQHGVETRVWGRGKPANRTKALLSCPGLLDQALVVELRSGGWQVTFAVLNTEMSFNIFQVNLWTCGLCGKSFYREPYLDMHMANKHSDALLKVCNYY